jgi:hypothetical protein
MQTPWAAWKARRATRAKYDAIVKTLALSAAEDYIERGERVPEVFDVSSGEGLATVTQLRPGGRPAGTRRARHRRRPSA